MNAARFLTAAELAEKLGMGKGSIYRLAKAGKIPHYAAGPKLTGLRFDLEEVLAILRRPVRAEAGGVKSDR